MKLNDKTKKLGTKYLEKHLNNPDIKPYKFSELEIFVKKIIELNSNSRFRCMTNNDVLGLVFYTNRAIIRFLKIASKEKKNINVDYYLDSGESGYFNFEPNVEKPSLSILDDFENYFDYFWKILKSVLDKYEDTIKNKEYEVSINIKSLKIPKECTGNIKSANLKLEVTESEIFLQLTHKGSKGYCEIFLDNKLWIIKTIWEYSGFISWDEPIRKFGSQIQKFNRLDKNVSIETSNNSLRHYWNEYFSHFSVYTIYAIPVCYFYLLDENFKCKRLSLALNFMCEANRSSTLNSIQFLNYWMSIEILLGEKDKEKISEAIENKSHIILGEKDTKEVMKLYKIRCKIVHTGEPTNVPNDSLISAKNISSKLFRKLLMDNLADT